MLLFNATCHHQLKGGGGGGEKLVEGGEAETDKEGKFVKRKSHCYMSSVRLYLL